jgi:flagellar assembly factor FliW
MDTDCSDQSRDSDFDESAGRRDPMTNNVERAGALLLRAESRGPDRLEGRFRNGRTRTRSRTMQINTTRFGVVALEMDDVFHFPQGLIGLESYRHWCLLRDPANDAVAWLQSVSTASLALPTASPRQFAPDYRV